MFEELDDESQLRCLRGYPFGCTAIEALLAGMDDRPLVLNEFCRNCRERLEYEGLHADFTV